MRMDYGKRRPINETVEQTQQRFYEFSDRYQTHVKRALMTAENLMRAQMDLNIFITSQIAVMPMGFMPLYERFIQANSENLEAVEDILKDWRYLISDDV